MKRLAVVLVLAVLGTACGDGGDSPSSEPACGTTTSGGQATSTIDPRCVTPAEGNTSTSDEQGRRWTGSLDTTEGGPGLEGGTNGRFTLTVGPDGTLTGSGTSHSTYTNSPPIDSRITVGGRRDGDTFHLTLALDPGTQITVDAPIRDGVATGEFELSGAAGAFSTGSVRLECQDCG